MIGRLQARGHEVIFADYYERPPAVETGVLHFRVSTLNEGAILELARSQAVQMISTSGTDTALVTGARVSWSLGLPFPLTPELANVVTHKVEMKRRLLEIGVPTLVPTAWGVARGGATPRVVFPAVVKPNDCAGSLGVMKVDNNKELGPALERAQRLSRSGSALVEAFSEGRELSVDAFVDQGIAHVLMVTESEKRPGLRQFPILRSWYPVGDRSTNEIEIVQIVQAIADGFGIGCGPLLVQMIESPMGLRVLEFGVRIGGGGKYALIQRVTGFDVLKAFIDTCLGTWRGPVEFSGGPPYAAMTYAYSASGRLAAFEGIDLLQAAGVIDQAFFFKLPGAVVEGQVASRDRPLSYICTASTQDELIEKLELAENKICIRGERGDDIRLRHPVVRP